MLTSPAGHRYRTRVAGLGSGWRTGLPGSGSNVAANVGELRNAPRNMLCGSIGKRWGLCNRESLSTTATTHHPSELACSTRCANRHYLRALTDPSTYLGQHGGAVVEGT